METSMVLSIVFVSALVAIAVALPFTEFGKQVPKPISNGEANVRGWGRLLTAIAVLVSWSVNQSIWWAIVHGTLGWIYLIYYALGYGR